jgi:D-alanyl-D-alanine carboxypeptidase (penicillin-binding protein 5/6)
MPALLLIEAYMFVIQRFILTGLIAVCFCLAPQAKAEDLVPAAKYVLIQDVNTGTVLFEQNADVPMPPASMSKLMTVTMVFERLADGSLHLDDRLNVTEKAWRMQGSKMFVQLGDQIRVEDLLRGVIIQSGNDACIVLAEGLAGSEAAFAERMNEHARKIGLRNATFKNATGWPDDGHLMSARDLATLATYITRKFPQYYHFFSEIDFEWNGIKQGNRNPLLYRAGGADGLKTGHTSVSGYGLTASAQRGARRIVVVMNGLNSMQQRADEASRLMDWAFREWEDYPLLRAGQAVDMADVWLGTAGQVPLVVKEDLNLSLRRSARPGMKVKVAYDNPISAPVHAGQPIGKLTIEAPGITPIDVPLVAGAEVDKIGLFARLGAAASYLAFGPKRPEGGIQPVLKALPQAAPLAPPPLPPAISSKPFKETEG